MLETKKQIIKYIIATVLCIIINIVYSLFSHNVFSNYMRYMFIIPICFLFISLISKDLVYRNLIASSALTLTFASLLKGIVVIAGTKTFYTQILFYLSILLLIISVVYIIVKRISSKH